MEVLKSLKLSLHLLGISERTGNVGLRVYTFIALFTVIMVNLAYFLASKWDRLDERINALKAITFLMPFIIYALTFIGYWDEFSQLLAVFYDPNFRYPYAISSDRKLLLGRLESSLTGLNRFWYRMISAYLISTVTAPLVIVLVKTSLFPEDFENVEESLSLPFPLYYPRGVAVVLTEAKVFAVGFVLHSLFTVYAAVYAHISNVTSLNALTIVEYELMLLRLSVLEMDRILEPPSLSQTTGYDTECGRDRRLRRFLSYFVRHHQNIYSKFNATNRGIRWIAATISTGASIYICMSIFTIIQKDQVVLKLQEAIFLFVWAFDIYMYDVGGERVKTQDENLRVALYESSWSEKPQWFKTALLIIMTRTRKSMDVKPFGLYALNLKSFAMTMNAAYSYYNLLYKFKAK